MSDQEVHRFPKSGTNDLILGEGSLDHAKRSGRWIRSPDAVDLPSNR